MILDIYVDVGDLVPSVSDVLSGASKLLSDVMGSQHTLHAEMTIAQIKSDVNLNDNSIELVRIMVRKHFASLYPSVNVRIARPTTSDGESEVIHHE